MLRSRGLRYSVAHREISCLACITSHLAALDNPWLLPLKLEISLRLTSHAYSVRNFKSRWVRYLMSMAFGTSLNALLTDFTII